MPKRGAIPCPNFNAWLAAEDATTQRRQQQIDLLTQRTSMADRDGAMQRMTQQLDKSRQGRLLRRWMDEFRSIVVGGATESPQRQTVNARRAVMHALREGTARSLGLPSKIPGIILVLNLSGDRMILYGKATEALRALIASSTPLQHQAVVASGVDKMLKFQKDSDNCCLLCSYSLPWAEDASQLFWEIRTITRSSTQEILDGQRIFNSHMPDVQNGTLVREPTELPFGRSESKALANEVVAVCIDNDGEDEESTAPTAPTDDDADSTPETVGLKNVVDMLKTDRKRLTGEIAALKAERKADIAKVEAAADRRCDEIAQKHQLVKEAASKHQAHFASIEADSKLKIADLNKQLADAKRERAIAELTLKTNAERFALEKKTLNAQLVEQKRLTSAAERQSQKTKDVFKSKTDELDDDNRREREDWEKRESQLQLRLQEANSTVDKLSMVLDARESELRLAIHEAEQNKGAAVRVNSLWEELATVEMQLDKTNKMLVSEQITSATLREELRKSSKTLETTRDELKQKKKDVRDRENQIRDRENQIRDRENQIRDAKAKSMETRESESDKNLKSENNELRVALRVARADLEASKEKADAMKSNAAKTTVTFATPETSPTKRSVSVATSCSSTGTHCPAWTQTDPSEEHEPRMSVNIVDATRLAHRYLQEVYSHSTSKPVSYNPSFQNHLPPSHFRFPGLVQGTQIGI